MIEIAWILKLAIGVFIGNIVSRIVWKWSDDLYRVIANKVFLKTGWKFFIVMAK